jgi:hypothetical protein
MRKKPFLLLVGLILTIGGWGQNDPSIINSSGGTATINSIYFDWSVGEMASVETYTNNSLTITQGFLQPFKLKSDKVDQFESGGEKITVYPDFGKQTCFFKTSFLKPGRLDYMLVDMSGRMLLKKETSLKDGTSTQSINLSNFPNGLYLLRISFNNNDESVYKTFKIQK